MSGFKDPDYLQRKNAATDARKAALEKFLSRNAAAAPESAAPGGAPAKDKAAKGKTPKSKTSGK